MDYSSSKDGSPPQDVFQMMGDINDATINNNNIAPAANRSEHDDEDPNDDEDNDIDIDVDNYEGGDGVRRFVEPCDPPEDGDGADLLLPTFDSKGKFQDYKTRDNDGGANGSHSHPNPGPPGSRKCNKKYAIVPIFLAIFLSIMVVVIVAGKKDKSNSAGVADNDNDRPIRPNLDFSKYGYPHTEETKLGWLSWPKEQLQPGKFLDSKATYAETAEDCAAKCSKQNVPTGSYSVLKKSCWCNTAGYHSLCKEPCVREEYVNFGKLSFGDLEYCEESVCEQGEYHTTNHCEVELKFSEEHCDSMKDALEFAENLQVPNTPSGTPANNNLDFSIYGYPHTKETTGAGWISWRDELDNGLLGKYYFTEGTYTDSAEKCAAKCNEEDTPTGTWSIKYKSCWCNTPKVTDLCKEPCVREEYINFARESLAVLDYCKESVCEQKWYHSREYCDVDIKFDKAECDNMKAALALASDLQPSTSDSTVVDLDLKAYGFPYSKKSDGGWISWPPEFDDDSFEGIKMTSLKECAAKCQELKVPTGAWSDHYKTCWCNSVETENICMEPCIENDYVDFSTVNFSDIDYCEKSICDKDWYYSASYCDIDVKFDKDACDAKLATIAASSWGLNLDKYGFPYSKQSDGGWVSWPPEFDDDSYEGVKMASLDECAAKCQELKVPTGAWSKKYMTCWCNPVEVANVCLEPCIENDYVDFSIVPFTDMDMCEKSICDKDWYYEQSYCDVDVKFDKDACDAKLATIASSSASDSDPGHGPLLDYGYPHVKITSRGWISWPPEFDENSFDDFEPENGITSLAECAKKCQGLNTPTGAWSKERQTCWCYEVAVANICMEPCLDNDYVDFSTVPFEDIDYCEKTVCDQDWYYDKNYCDVDLKFDKDACDAKLEALGLSPTSPSVPSPTPATVTEPSATEYDLSTYGYTYVDVGPTGWLNWPPEFDNENSVEIFGSGAGISSVEECAEKCKSVDAITGAWSSEYNTCRCYHVQIKDMCREPCIENDYVNFSAVTFYTFQYCKKSICDKDWYYSADYCDVDVQFDKDSCDAKIEALSEIHIAPDAVASIREADPDAYYGQESLRVEKDKSISFIRFSFSTLSEGHEITKATLKLHMTATVESQATSTIDIDHVYADDWSDDESTITWNDPLEFNIVHSVNSFDVSALPSETTKKLIEVDVTSAINPKYEGITFRLSTKSTGIWWFASIAWNGDKDAAPELVIKTADGTN